MQKLNILITAGPTREHLDPVRFLSNVSTGELGYALARKSKQMGHAVTLISGPVAVKSPKNVRLIPIMSAEDMKSAIVAVWKKTDVLIMTAAVCDYTPVQYSKDKIKRVRQKTVRFKRTPDILQHFGLRKAKRLVVGFSLETSDVIENAKRKLNRKKADFIVVNWYNKNNVPFGKTKFSTLILDKKGGRKELNRVTKDKAAELILKHVLKT